MPCGGIYKKQCPHGCSEALQDISEEEKEQISDVDSFIKLGNCPSCGKPLIFNITNAFGGGGMMFFMIPFFALHLMPVWIWLGSTLTAGKRWKNTMYYVTNRRIIIQGGFLAVNEKSVFYKDLRNAQLHIGLIDKACGTGSIVLDDGYYDYHRRRNYPGSQLAHLEDAQSAYHRIQKIILDIQTDIEYPNAYRPETNPGYGTDYRPE